MADPRVSGDKGQSGWGDRQCTNGTLTQATGHGSLLQCLMVLPLESLILRTQSWTTETILSVDQFSNSSLSFVCVCVVFVFSLCPLSRP